MNYNQLRRAVTPAVFVAVGLLACSEAPTEQKTVPEGLRPAFAPGGSLGVNLDQWANGTATTPATWQNGNLNGNNSTYAERKSVPFRLAIEGLPGGTAQHTITINYDFTAGGHKAYDFLASIDASEPNALARICSVGGGGVSLLCGTSTEGMPGSVPFEDEPFPADPFSVDGKDVDGAIADGGFGPSDRKLRIYGGEIVSIGPVQHSGPTGGNSTAQMLVTFTSTGSSALLAWSGHLAYSVYWNGPSDPDGAGEVSGAPWHMRTLNLNDGGAANQDRSIQPSAIVETNPAVEVDKTGDAQSKVGDVANYSFTIRNTGDVALTLVSVIDDVIGDLTALAQANGCTNLAPAAQCSFSTTYTVQGDDPDPLVNTVTVTYNHTGGQATDTDSHTTSLFQPSVTIDKTGPANATVGQSVTYTFTITNTSSADSPNLIIDSVIDDVIGSLAAEATNAGCNTLASGASCNFTKSRTVLAGDPDPLVNTVTVHYHPSGFPNDITDSDDHSLDIVAASVVIDKTGDAISKVGDPVNYQFTITNTGGVALTLTSVIDDVLGSLTTAATNAGCGTLAPGASCNFTAQRTVQAADPDPLVNTVTATYSFSTGGGSGTATDSDSHSTNLFQPSVLVTKTSATTQAVVGQNVSYTFTIQNTSSNDSPNLVLVSATDDVIGDLTADAAGATPSCSSLAPGASCSFSKSRAIQVGDADPLVNTFSVLYNPSGFPNEITDSDDHSVDILHPSFTVAKACAVNPVPLGVASSWVITVTNNGDADLAIDVQDLQIDVNTQETLAAGASKQYTGTGATSFTSGTVLNNTATVTATISGTTYSDQKTASATCTYETVVGQPSIEIDQLTFNVGEPPGSNNTMTGSFRVTDAGDTDSFTVLVINFIVEHKKGGPNWQTAVATCTTNPAVPFAVVGNGASQTVTFSCTLSSAIPNNSTVKTTVQVEIANRPNVFSHSTTIND